MITLTPQPLTRGAFAPFGEVVEIEGAQHFAINQGYAERYNDLARVDASATNVSIVIAKPRPSPIMLDLMERHPLGSQIFYPLQDRPWLVVVCEEPNDPTSFHAFAATGRQGVNYARNVWHHPLLVFDADSRFMVVDRRGDGVNLEEKILDASMICGSLPQK
jgi:ureidoglycolate lyase